MSLFRVENHNFTDRPADRQTNTHIKTHQINIPLNNVWPSSAWHIIQNQKPILHAWGQHPQACASSQTARRKLAWPKHKHGTCMNLLLASHTGDDTIGTQQDAYVICMENTDVIILSHLNTCNEYFKFVEVKISQKFQGLSGPLVLKNWGPFAFLLFFFTQANIACVLFLLNSFFCQPCYLMYLQSAGTNFDQTWSQWPMT